MSITTDNYSQHPAINQSLLKKLLVSPKQFKYERDNPRPDAPHFRVGRLAHTLILEPHLVDEHYALYEGRRAGKAWQEFQVENQDKTILNRTELTKCEGIARAVLGCPEAVRHFRAPIEIERALRWFDEETGAECKARLDVIGRAVVDIKTSASLTPRRFERAAVDYGYHIQCAFYHDGALANGYELQTLPVLIAVDSAPPHDVIVYQVPEHVIEFGREEYRRLLSLYIQCEANDHWPGQAEGLQTLELPDWAYPTTEMPALTFGGSALEDA